MLCVITDGFWLVNPKDELPWLENILHGEVKLYTHTSPEELYQRAENAQILVVNKVRLGVEEFKRLPKLQLVVVAATGYNSIDTTAARQAGVVVCNVPDYSTNDIAQTVFAYIMEHCRQVHSHAQAVRDGQWANSSCFSFWLRPPIGITGKVLGIVGLGRIGRKVAAIANGFGMQVVGCSDRIHDDAPDYVEWLPLDEVISRSDFLSLHLPLNARTAKLINRQTIAKMKDGAMLINTSRGGLMDEDAVAEALHTGKLSCVAVDVLAEEPPDAHNKIINAPNSMVTPHYAWTSIDDRTELFRIVTNNIQAFLDGAPINRVG